jgi:F420-dependent methylenetetrahydromethanopterin dehydrogenase
MTDIERIQNKMAQVKMTDIERIQNKMAQVKTTSTVFVLHHTNQGTPESGEIHSIYTTKSSALAAMAEELENGYDGVTMQDNADEDYVYMYITEQYLKN